MTLNLLHNSPADARDWNGAEMANIAIDKPTWAELKATLSSVHNRKNYTLVGYFSEVSGGQMVFNHEGVADSYFDKFVEGDDEVKNVYARWTKGIVVTFTTTEDSKFDTVLPVSSVVDPDNKIFPPISTLPSYYPIYKIDSNTYRNINDIPVASYFKPIEVVCTGVANDNEKVLSAAGVGLRKFTGESDISLTPEFQVNHTTVSFDNNYGDSETSVSGSSDIDYGSAVERVPTPERSGYTFLGYFDAKTAGTQYYDEYGESVVENWENTEAALTLYAQWEHVEIDVNFDAGDGTCSVAKKTFQIGGIYGTLPNATAPANHIFKGWYTAENGQGTKIDSETEVDSSVTTLYAYYTVIYTVTFDGSYGVQYGTIDGDIDQRVESGGSIVLPTLTYTSDSYIGEFNGWYDTNGVLVGNAGDEYTPTSSVSLNASWTELSSTTVLTLSYNYTDCPTALTESVHYGEAMTAITPPTRTNYRFVGYYDAAENGNQYYDGSGNPTYSSKDSWDKGITSYTLYAHWELSHIDVTFNAGAGTASETTKNYEIGKAYESLPTVTAPANKSFSGWYTESTGGSKITTSSIVSASVTTLYAHYVDLYTVTFNATGNAANGTATVTNNSVTVVAGESITLPTPTYTSETHTGSFGGWRISGTSTNVGSSTYTPDGNVTLDGTWTEELIIHQFNVLFNATGNAVHGTVTGGPSNTIVEEGDSVSLFAPTYSSTGYTAEFNGWKNGTTNVGNTSFSPTEDVTLVASWTETAKTTAIALKANYAGGTDSSTSATYDSEMTSVTPPTRDNWIFLGYYDAESGGNQYYNSSGSPTHADKNKWANANATLDLYAHWEQTHVTVTFNAGSGTCDTATNTYELSKAYTSLPTATPPTNYRFKGWYTGTNGSGTKIETTTTASASVTTVYAYYVALYTVTFNSTGNVTHGTVSNGPSNTTIEAGGSVYLTSPTYSSTGYTGTFNGWKNGSTNVGKNKNYIPNSSVSLVASWTETAKTTAVTLNANYTGGTNGSATFTYDSQIPAVTPPTRTNWKFLGYYDAASGGNKYYNADGSRYITTVWSNTDATKTLYAHWEQTHVTVTFNAGSGTCSTATSTYELSKTYTSLPTPTPPTNYRFKDWYTGTNGSGTKITTSSTATASVTTLYAYYIELYTVKFSATGNASHGTGSGGPSTTTVEKGSSVTLSNPTYSSTGYTGTFNGWMNGSTNVGKSSFAPTASVTLTANWTETAKKTSVTLNANYTGGTNGSATFTYDSQIPAVTPPTRTNWEFLGYYDAASGGNKYYNADGSRYITTTWSSTDSTKTLYAHWNQTHVTVSFNAGDGSCTPTSKTYQIGSAYSTFPTVTAPSGKRFKGWYTASGGTGTKKETTTAAVATVTTLYAYYVSLYTVTFNATGNIAHGSASGGPSSTTIEAGQSVTLSAPTYSSTGYTGTFNGWYNGSTSIGKTGTYTPTGSCTITASWTETAKTTAVTLAANYTGGTNGSTTFTYDSQIPSVTVPTRTNWSFLGYYDAASGGTKYYNNDGTRAITTAWNSTATSKTLYAHWQQTNVVVTFNAGSGTCATASNTYSLSSTYGWLPTATAPANYTFAGWYTGSDGSGSQVATTSTPSASVTTLYAYYLPQYTITFNATGNAGNGVTGGPSNTTITAGQSVTLTTPTYSNTYYNGTFNGWYIGTTYIGKTGSYKPTSSCTIRADWTISEKTEYQVSAYIDSPSNATLSVNSAYGGSLVWDSAIYYYRFSGFIYGAVKCTPSSGYECKSYKITTTSDATTYTASGGDGVTVEVGMGSGFAGVIQFNITAVNYTYKADLSIYEDLCGSSVSGVTITAGTGTSLSGTTLSRDGDSTLNFSVTVPEGYLVSSVGGTALPITVMRSYSGSCTGSLTSTPTVEVVLDSMENDVLSSVANGTIRFNGSCWQMKVNGSWCNMSDSKSPHVIYDYSASKFYASSGYDANSSGNKFYGRLFNTSTGVLADTAGTSLITVGYRDVEFTGPFTGYVGYNPGGSISVYYNSDLEDCGPSGYGMPVYVTSLGGSGYIKRKASGKTTTQTYDTNLSTSSSIDFTIFRRRSNGSWEILTTDDGDTDGYTYITVEHGDTLTIA